MRFDLLTLIGVASLATAFPQEGPSGSPELAGPSNRSKKLAGAADFYNLTQYHDYLDVDPEFVHEIMNNETHYNVKRDDLRVDINSGTRGLFICFGHGWKGECSWIGGVGDQRCRNMQYQEDAAMSPDKGVHCTLYRSLNCPGTGYYPLVYPGVSNFDTDVWGKTISWTMCDQGKDIGCRFSPASYKCQVF